MAKIYVDGRAKFYDKRTKVQFEKYKITDEEGRGRYRGMYETDDKDLIAFYKKALGFTVVEDKPKKKTKKGKKKGKKTKKGDK